MTDHSDTPEHDPLAPRAAAVEVLHAVLVKRRPLDDALAASAAFSSLGGHERPFAGHLVRTALRRLGEIDGLIDNCLEKPLPKKALPVRDILRVGIVQLLFSATAAHAAVTTSVDLCRSMGLEPYAKLVNAVLRRLQREGAATRSAAADADARNTPDWLWESWCAAYGAPTAAAIAEQHLQVPPLDLTPRSEPARWAEILGGTVVLDGTVRLADGGDVTKLTGFDDGAWWVQDAAARIPVALLGDLAGKNVYDLCAAPGGKTLELCAAGARVTALDISEKRLTRIAENLARTGFDATLVAADAKTWSAPGPADIVVLDAPCSSTGTLRRHPDVAHLKTPNDVAKLARVQDGLLDAAAAMVRPGGTLLYSTCSLETAEGPDRISAFLSRHAGFQRSPFAPEALPGLPEAITREGDLRTLPCHLAAAGGMDGFYAARLLRQNGV